MIANVVALELQHVGDVSRRMPLEVSIYLKVYMLRYIVLKEERHERGDARL